MAFMLSLVIQTGMWMERFVIVIVSLHRDFMPSAWGMYYPTFWDYTIFFGTIAFFFACFLAFAKLLPVISISEMRELVHQTHGGEHEAAEFEPKYAN